MRSESRKKGPPPDDSSDLDLFHKPTRLGPASLWIVRIDGRFSCTLLELGFEPAETSIFAVLSLTAGVIADIMEQMRQKPSLQPMVGMPYAYTGETDRPLPDEFIRDRV